MALILCIDTATEICSVALTENGKVLSLHEVAEPNQHASQLTLLIQEALTTNGKSLQELDAIAVSKGPGSYTGLRVGVSTAKGLCYTLGKPLLAVNTLQSLAAVALKQINTGEPCLLLPMIDARRMEVYCCLLNQQLETIMPTKAEVVTSQSFSHLTDKPLYFFGNGAAKCAPLINQANAQLLEQVQCSASGMAELAYTLFEKGLFEDVAYFEPFYLKDFVGTTPRKNP